MDEEQLLDFVMFLRGQLGDLGLLTLRDELDEMLTGLLDPVPAGRRDLVAVRPADAAVRCVRTLRTAIMLDLGRSRVLARSADRINESLARASEYRVEAISLAPASVGQEPRRGLNDDEVLWRALSRGPRSDSGSDVEPLDGILAALDEALELLVREGDQ